jgi:hypothetical protein
MSENLVIKLTFPGKDGKKVPIELPVSGINKLISDLLRVAESLPQQAALEVEFQNEPDPAQATAFAITPIEDRPDHARLSIAVGAIQLQFSVPLGPLFEALKVLKAQTEPDPMSGPRLN